MATTVTVKGQVTLPKAAREAAGIRPGDRVEVRVRPEGGLIVERETAEPDPRAVEENMKRIDRAIAGLRLSAIDGRMSSDEWMLLRGED
ncbi:MAG TPA: AbrB/MazE/SpoVT family DNA-binding domain-containing protein [Roseiarcus sp.]|nr:AbrB/MazE/SpoVT family DNA-binding domain-containing protein [Roseiarcus sp.]